MEHVPDISYGVYLYGWPVESLWIWYHRAGYPGTTFAVSLVLCTALGWLSWHFVERPFMRLKRRPSAPVVA
jgi:peptidoglycan/LPS O-acetylase OafA/YrhL